MSTVTLYIAASLDGFIADEGGAVDWLETFEDDYDAGEPGGSYESFIEDIDCLVMGANTYEQVLSFGDWPYEDRRTVVATHRELPRATDQVELYGGPIKALVSELRADHDHVWLVGGAALARSFLAAGLLDEIRLSVVPMLLGGGVSLFGDGGTPRELHLVDTTAFRDGIVELCYDVPAS